MTTTYPTCSLTADAVVFRFHGGHLELLLIKRRHAPFAGAFALPGGYVEPAESPETAAARELMEETGVSALHWEPLGVFGAPGRDPRGWTVSAVFLALAAPDAFAKASDDAAELGWHRVSGLRLTSASAPEGDGLALAFDHHEMVHRAIARLAELTQTGTVPLKLLPPTFRTAQARVLYAQILGHPIKPAPFKAWLRRREAVTRIGLARFSPAPKLSPDWLR